MDFKTVICSVIGKPDIIQHNTHIGSSDVTAAVTFTSVHKEQCHLGGAESFGSSPSHHAGKTSCHSGSRYLGAITDQPHGCPK